MAGPSFYKVVKVEVIVGIPRDELDPILDAAGVLTSLKVLLDENTIKEPLTVRLRDQGYTDPNATPRILELDPVAVQIDAGLNEVPRATVLLAVGRDLAKLSAGNTDLESVSLVHLLERYLDRQITCRIYAHATTTAEEGVVDFGDLEPWADEWVCLFDGLTTGPTRRGTPEESSFALHLAHFTSVLTYSSSLSAEVAASSSLPISFQTSVFPTMLTGLTHSYTAAGSVTASLSGGDALYTDFWGYAVPRAQPQPSGVVLPQTSGLKGLLTVLAETDLFNWPAIAASDTNGDPIVPPTVGAPNTAALAALDRIEPFWSGLVDPAQSRADWTAIRKRIELVRANNKAAGSTRAVDRADILADPAAAAGYNRAGYLYGVPLAFFLNDSAFAPLHAAGAMAQDICMVTFQDLGSKTFWDLCTGGYASKYQFAVAPMADRAVVVPGQPALDGSWQNVYASEIDAWEDDLPVPVPIRGVVLVSDRGSTWGTAPGVNAATPGAALRFQQLEATYDSKGPGVFEFHAMPSWLNPVVRLPKVWGTQTMTLPKAFASVPRPTAVAAQTAVAIVLGMMTGNPVLAGFLPGAMTAPTDAQRSTANRLAKALWQQARLRPRTAFFRGRFRYDIGPGSHLRVEVPADRYVRDATVGKRDTLVAGVVLRMSITINAEEQTASTSFQLGFARTEAETKKGNPLFSDAHPFWSTATYGVPWADAVWLRARLADKANIQFGPG